jgi:hypothetical protein
MAHLSFEISHRGGMPPFYRVSVEVDDVIERAFMPLDFSAPNSDPLCNLLCTDHKTIKEVIRLREGAFESLSKQIADMLIEAMSRDDTINGYKK